MKRILLIVGAIYFFLVALSAYPDASSLVASVELKVPFQVADALRLAGWEDVNVGLASNDKTMVPVYAFFPEKEFRAVNVYFGEDSLERASYLAYEVDPNPDSIYATKAVQLSSSVAFYIADHPERIARTVQIIINHSSPATPPREQLWRLLMNQGITKIRPTDFWLGPIIDAVLIILEPGRRLLLSLLFIPPISALSTVFRIWKVAIYVFPLALLLLWFRKRIHL